MSFFENQKELSAQVSTKGHVWRGIGKAKSKLNSARRENIAGKVTHPLRQIAETISFRIDCPDNVAHRINQLARQSGDCRERARTGSLAIALPPLCHFAQE